MDIVVCICSFIGVFHLQNLDILQKYVQVLPMVDNILHRDMKLKFELFID